MGLTVHINHEAEFGELTGKYPCFGFLGQARIPRDDDHTWRTNDRHWGYVDKTTHAVQMMVIGKTGYGKSTTLNRLVGRDVFDTDAVSVCTKDLYCGMYRIDSSVPSFFMVSDLPGVGESHYADDHYYGWYRDMLQRSDLVLYVLRADQRDYAIDEMVFSNLFDSPDKKRKVVIALNYADKIEPVRRAPGLSEEQRRNLDLRAGEISRKFGVDRRDVIAYSAQDGVDFDRLIHHSAGKLRELLAG